MKKTILYILIFALVGELMVRFDEYFTLLEENRVVKISTDIELTPEYQLLKSDSFTVREQDLRILVIGDSYIHGGGIEFKDNFSQHLKRMIHRDHRDQGDAWVLDVSRPDANNLDNNQTYFRFVDDFKPDIVIIGYNFNDVEGNLEKQEAASPVKAHLNEIQPSGAEAKTLIRKIYNIAYQSHFLQYTLHALHNQLKVYGFAIPNSRFDISLRSYYEERENWKKSKALLTEIIEDARQKEVQLIVYQMPEFNLMEYPKLFAKARQAIASFFERYPAVVFLAGSDTFSGESAKDYILSRYDGHPNEKAHEKMAAAVYEVIRQRRPDVK